MKTVRMDRTPNQANVIWTPWGPQRPAENAAQKLASLRLVRKATALSKLAKPTPATAS
jgi:hypothetical protein